MTIHILLHPQEPVSGKVADAELHFNEGLLCGLKLMGFSIWKHSTTTGHTVTFPTARYAVNGERRPVTLLQPIRSPHTPAILTQAILDAYAWATETDTPHTST